MAAVAATTRAQAAMTPLSPVPRQVVDDPSQCRDIVGVPKVARIPVRLRLAPLAHASQLVNHLLESLLVRHP